MYTHPAGGPGPRTMLRSLLVLLACVLAVWSAPAHAFSGYGGVTTDTTWTGTVVLIGDVVVEPQAILRIAPGTRVVFSATSNVFNDPAGETGPINDLIVKGTLKALGAANDSIYFVSSRATIVEGDWGGVRFDSSAVDTACVIDYAVFRGGTRALYFNRSGATVTHASLDYSSIAGVAGDSVVADCHLSELATHTNKQYGVQITNFYGSLLRSRLTGARLGEVQLTGGNGRFAENTILNDRFARGAGLILSNSQAVVARDSFINNALAMTTLGNATPRVDSCYFSGNDIGLQADVSAPSIGSTRFLSNGVALDVLQGGVPVVGDSLSAACDFIGNALDIRNVKGNVSFVRCHFNYWGTTNEDSLFARMVNGVDPSPWTDAAHQAQIRAMSYGVYTSGVTWSGTVFVRGDIVVPAGSALAILPGTVVKFQSGFATWDTLSINPGLCDIEVFGTLSVTGSLSDTTQMVRFTSDAATPAPGQWGSIYFDPTGGGTIVGAITEYGSNGFTVYGSPVISYSTMRFHSKHGCYINGLYAATPSLLRCTAQWNPTGYYMEQGPGFPTLQSCVAEHNSGDGLYAFFMPPQITSCRMEANAVGMHLVQAGPTVLGDTLRANTQYGLLGESISLPGATLQFGSATQPNLLVGNGLAAIKNATNEDIIQAGLNCWGTDDEDAVAAQCIGSVNYSPWFTAACTDTVSATSFGVLRSDATWSGTRPVRGDIVVPVGSTLYIAPGTELRAAASRSAFDDGAGVTQRVDLIVLGRVVVGQPGGQRVVFTTDAAAPVAGQAGMIRLVNGAVPADSLVGLTMRGWSGVRSDAGSPVLSADSLAAPAAGGTTLALAGGLPLVSSTTLGAPAGGVGLSLVNTNAVVGALTVTGSGSAAGVRVTGGSPVLDMVTVSGADTALALGWSAAGLVNGGSYTGQQCGIAVAAGAPVVQSATVSAARTGVLADMSSAASFHSLRATATAAGVTLADVRGASTPRFENCVFDNAGQGGAAVGVWMHSGGRADLGGGIASSAGFNVLKGYAPGAQSAVVTDASVPGPVSAQHCFWGVSDTLLIPALVVDQSDDGSFPAVVYSPVLTYDVAAHVWSAHVTASRGTTVTLAIQGEPGARVHVVITTAAGDVVREADAVLDGGGRGEVPLALAAGAAYRYTLLDAVAARVLAEGAVELPAEDAPLTCAIRGGASGMPRLALRVPAGVSCEVAVYRLDGRRVAAARYAGDGREHTIDLPASGAGLAVGVYWVHASTPATTVTRRAVVLR